MPPLASVIARLRALDPTAWGFGLSPENLRTTWVDAVDALERADVDSPLAGTAPRRVLLIASANVHVAPLPWMVHLGARGVEVRVKPARGQLAAVQAMAEIIGAEVTPWVGGDIDAEARAMADVDGVIAFGGAETLAAIGERVPPGVVWLPFGPRFGIAVVDRVDAGVVLDHALFDGRGCMSPAAVFVRDLDLDEVAGLCEDAERRLPRGACDGATASRIRSRVALARMTGGARTGPTWGALSLPLAHFAPDALPRVLCLHPCRDLEEVVAAVAPWADQLGTVATRTPLPEPLASAPRVCLPGEMQRPPADRWHDGVDVLGALWRST